MHGSTMSHSWLAAPRVVRQFFPTRQPRSRERRSSTRCLPNNSKCTSELGSGTRPTTAGEDDILFEAGIGMEKFTTFGRFSTSPKSVLRVLTEYDRMQNTSRSILNCKRIWISSRVGRTVLRLQSRDRDLLWGAMGDDVVVEIEEDIQNGKLSFRADSVDDRAAFAVEGKWIVRPVKDATYLCDIGLELEVIPLQFEVAKRSLRRWLHSQVPDVVQHVVARSVELEQAQLQAPRFLPALETTFGANFERSSGPEEKKGSSGGPLGYLGLSELPLRLRDDGRDYESGTVRRVPSHNPGYASVSNPVQSSGTGSKINGEAETMTKGQDEVRNTSSVVTDGSVPPSGRWFIDDDDNLSRPGASEVHMRRFDTDTTLHRRALGAVRIEAPPDVVYRLLTNFESMPNFIPNLALTERVDLPFSLRNRPGRTRLRQVFLKCHLYHLLQTGITLDVVQKDDKGEIQFRVLDSGARGEILQGKWLVVPCPAEEDMSMAKLDANDFARGQPKTGDEDTSVLSISLNADEKSKNTRESRKRKGNEATILKFAIEGRALRRRSSRGFWLSSGPITATEARDISLSSILPERAVFEEVLLMLHSAREYFQATFQREQHASSPLSFHPDIPYMSDGTLSMDQLDDRLSSLRSQMLALGFGTDGVMPRRAELRDLGAYSIEQAIVNAGGFDVVAKQLGWTNNRKKPRGYWSNLVNVEREVLSFIVENDLEPGVMPSRPQLEELGRRDIAKSLARHGGSTVIAEKIGLVARRRPRKSMTSIGFPEKKNGNLS